METKNLIAYFQHSTHFPVYIYICMYGIRTYSIQTYTRTSIKLNIFFLYFLNFRSFTTKLHNIQQTHQQVSENPYVYIYVLHFYSLIIIFTIILICILINQKKKKIFLCLHFYFGI